MPTIPVIRMTIFLAIFLFTAAGPIAASIMKNDVQSITATESETADPAPNKNENFEKNFGSNFAVLLPCDNSTSIDCCFPADRLGIDNSVSALINADFQHFPDPFVERKEKPS